jgi:hypothetical protein
MKVGAAVLAGKLAAPEADPMLLAGVAALQEVSNLTIDHLAGKNRKESPTTIWTKLFAHAKTVETEVPRVQKKAGDLPASADWWGVPDQNSLNLYISEGIFLWDFIPEGDLPRYDGGYPLHDIYRPCPCGSGSKFKFCCKGLERFDFQRR